MVIPDWISEIPGQQFELGTPMWSVALKTHFRSVIRNRRGTLNSSASSPSRSGSDQACEGVTMNSDSEAVVVRAPVQPAQPTQSVQPILPTQPTQPARSDGSVWVQLADQIVAEMQSPQAPVRVLHAMFERSDDLQDLAMTPSGNLPSAAQIFDSLVYAPKSAMSARLGANFEVVALPRQAVKGQVCAGDIIVRRAEGPSAHVSIVGSPGLMTLEGLKAEGLIAESRTPGQYVHVVEGGAFPHESEDKYARQLTDSFGRVLNDIVLLRLATPPPTVVTINQSAQAKDDPLAPLPDSYGETSNGCPADIEEVIRGWGQYQDSVDKLPREERDKINRLSELVVGSFATPGCTSLGQISVVGHADSDYHGPAFEQRVSVQRAQSVAASLSSAIAENWQRRGLAGSWTDSIRFEPTPYGVGASEPDPANVPKVANRLLNRRAIIKLRRSSAPVRERLGWPDAPLSGATSELVSPPPLGWNRGEAAIKEAATGSGLRVVRESSEQVRIEPEQRIGSIRRIPVAGLRQGNQNPNRVPETDETADGRAIVLLPATLDLTQPAEVLFHLHGHNVGFRHRKTQGRHPSLRVGSVRDVETDQIEQQIEESGRPYIAVLPQGTTSSGFGQITPRLYIDEVFQALTTAGVWTAAPPIKSVLLTAHSGGGEIISTMMAEPGQPRMPANLKIVALFDAINGDKTEFPNVKNWVLDQLERNLRALAAAASSEDKYRYLNGSTRFRAYFTDGPYSARHGRLEKEIDDWFKRNAAGLGGSTSEFFLTLRGNYQVIRVGPVDHEVIMAEGDPHGVVSVGRQLRQVLAPAFFDRLSPIRADEAGKILITFNVGRFSVFVPEKVILSTRKDFDPTPNLSVHIFFSAGAVQGNLGNDVLTHGLRGASAQSEWVTIGVHSHNVIRDWEITDCLVSIGIRGPIARMRLSGHSRGGESLRTTILQKAITTLSLIDRVFLLDCEDNPSPPPNGPTVVPKSQQLTSAGVDPAIIVAYEVNVRKSHTSRVKYLSIDSGCSAAIGYVRLIRDAMVTQPGIDALVQANRTIVAQLDSLPLPTRGLFSTQSASGLISIQKFCSDNRAAIASILGIQTHPTNGLLSFINRNNLARFAGFTFDQGISAHHFFAAEVAHELFD
jgi:hypothetical protein